jgi:hypothetical protein
VLRAAPIRFQQHHDDYRESASLVVLEERIDKDLAPVEEQWYMRA